MVDIDILQLIFRDLVDVLAYLDRRKTRFLFRQMDPVFRNSTCSNALHAC